MYTKNPVSKKMLCCSQSFWSMQHQREKSEMHHQLTVSALTRYLLPINTPERGVHKKSTRDVSEGNIPKKSIQYYSAAENETFYDLEFNVMK